jgi:hypothetical protein
LSPRTRLLRSFALSSDPVLALIAKTLLKKPGARNLGRVFEILLFVISPLLSLTPQIDVNAPLYFVGYLNFITAWIIASILGITPVASIRSAMDDAYIKSVPIRFSRVFWSLVKVQFVSILIPFIFAFAFRALVIFVVLNENEPANSMALLMLAIQLPVVFCLAAVDIWLGLKCRLHAATSLSVVFAIISYPPFSVLVFAGLMSDLLTKHQTAAPTVDPYPLFSWVVSVVTLVILLFDYFAVKRLISSSRI